MSSYLWLFLGSTAVDAMAIGGSLWLVARTARRTARNPWVRLRDIPLVLGFVMIVFLVKLPVHRVLGVNNFGLMHLVYLAMSILVPLTALGILTVAVYRGTKNRPVAFSRGVLALACMLLLAAPVAGWATFVEPYALRNEHQDIALAGANAADRPIRIAVLADIQTDRITGYERRAIDQAMALEADVILLPGDFFQGSPEAFERELPAYRDLMKRLDAPGGVFAVRGNIDYMDQLQEILHDTGVRLLDNEVVFVRVHGCRIALGGLGYPHHTVAAKQTIEWLGRVGDDADLAVLLSHTPDPGLSMDAESGIDLIVAGHTHGGQVQIPGVGPLITGCRSSRATSAGGLSLVNDVLTYVSRGVGHERGQAPRLRLFCPPEISLLTLVTR